MILNLIYRAFRLVTILIVLFVIIIALTKLLPYIGGLAHRVSGWFSALTSELKSMAHSAGIM